MKSEISEPSRDGHETNSKRLENLLKKKNLTEEESAEIKVLMMNKVAINSEIEATNNKVSAIAEVSEVEASIAEEEEGEGRQCSNFSYSLYRNSVNTMSTKSYNTAHNST